MADDIWQPFRGLLGLVYISFSFLLQISGKNNSNLAVQNTLV